jgi:hypothetical protein
MLQQGSTMQVGDAGTAAAAGRGRGAGIVLLAGAITTVLALLGVWWLDNNTTDFHVMGWYADYVLPIGAMLVGLAAGSGYGIASYLTGFRIRRGVLTLVLALQLGGYFAAQFLEFRSLTREGPLVDEAGETITFARYYHLRAVSFAWNDHGKPGQPLGGWGYFFVALGVVGFALGGMLAPAILLKAPYCESCQLYMKSHGLALVPASVPKRRVSRKDAEGQAAFKDEQDRAARGADTVLGQVGELAARGDAFGIKTALAAYPIRGGEARRIDRLPARLRLRLVGCRACSDGYIQPAMITGQGRAIRVQALAQLPLRADAVRIIASS